MHTATSTLRKSYACEKHVLRWRINMQPNSKNCTSRLGLSMQQQWASFPPTSTNHARYLPRPSISIPSLVGLTIPQLAGSCTSEQTWIMNPLHQYNTLLSQKTQQINNGDQNLESSHGGFFWATVCNPYSANSHGCA